MDAYDRSRAIEQATMTRVAEIYAGALRKALKNKKAFLQKVKDVETGKIKPPSFFKTDAQIALWKEGFLREMIRQKEVQFGWEFLFLGANIDAAREAARFGIRADHAANYHADRQGTSVIYETVSEAVSHVRCCSQPLQADWKKKIDKDYKTRG